MGLSFFVAMDRTRQFKYTFFSIDGDFAAFSRNFHDFCRQCNVDKSNAYDMEVSVEELVVNSLSYGNRQGPVEVSADITDGGEQMKVMVKDTAWHFNPLEDAPPEAERRERVGGFGINLVKTLNDHVEYSASPKGNIVTLFKLLEKSSNI